MPYTIITSCMQKFPFGIDLAVVSISYVGYFLFCIYCAGKHSQLLLLHIGDPARKYLLASSFDRFKARALWQRSSGKTPYRNASLGQYG